MNFMRKLLITAVSGAAFGAGVYLAVTQLGPQKPQAPDTEIKHLEGVGAYIPREQSKEVHDYLAPKYDKMVAPEEMVAGVSKLREKMGSKARGQVLEIAIGSGRNLSFYGPSVTHITGLDYSSEMMKQAMTKVCTQPLKLVLGDAHDLLSSVGGKRFDTVVDSFGLCSFEDPVLVLKQMQAVCKPDGQILLLEHGASDSKWMRIYMNSKSQKHAHSWACIFNRDIDSIIEASGLIVEHKERKHFGTTYFIIAKPSPEHCPPL
jgi:methyltransferase OMS1